jgi:hypothetical protein
LNVGLEGLPMSQNMKRPIPPDSIVAVKTRVRDENFGFHIDSGRPTIIHAAKQNSPDTIP